MTTSTPAPGERADLTLDSLRALLETFNHLPGDTPVIVQKDAEGNDWSPLHSGAEGMYEASTPYSGDAYPTPEAVAASTDEETREFVAPEDAVRVVILCPRN
ncbi:hypothetical protein ACFWVB_20285 [Streptomyces microflavus]|uniref:hypothetical protein n=1 Tax=Streptomyces microflavus TaxID=1919 RepID=UPI003665E979